MGNELDPAKLKEIAEDALEAEEDGTRIKNHSLKDLIAMDQYLRGIAAADSDDSGIIPGVRISLLKPPGAYPK